MQNARATRIGSLSVFFRIDALMAFASFPIRRQAGFAPVVILAACLLADEGQAQWSPDATLDLGMGYGQMALSQSALDGTRAIGDAGEKAFDRRHKPAVRKAKATAISSGSLTFRSTPAITRTVNDRFVAWQSRRHPELRQELAKGIESGTLQAYFRRILSRYHYDPDNLADVSSAYYISLWRIMHGRDVTTSQAEGVRRQMRENMTRDSRLMGLPDTQKQEISETFALHTALALQGYEQLRSSGDHATLAAFQRGLQAKLAPQGPDLDALTITDKGFFARR